MNTFAVGETVTVVHTDNSGVYVCNITDQTETHLVVFDGELEWHVRKDAVSLNSDGVHRTTSNHVFLHFGY